MMFSEMIEFVKDQITEKPRFEDFKPHALSYNSLNVGSGDVFFAIKGIKSDGNKFINDSFTKGAKAVVTDSNEPLSDSRVLHVKDARKAMALMSSRFYGFPSSKMKIIGITGTNGKTTISSLLYHIFSANGKKSGLIGTNGNFVNNRFIKTIFTTPESVDLQRLLKDMADEGVEIVSMEVSSHSLEMSRVYGIDFDIAVFTNLTTDHLDFHGDMNNYFRSKKILFDSLKRINTKNNKTSAIYNIDDNYGDKIISSTEGEHISYGMESGLYKCVDYHMDFSGTRFRLLVPRNSENISEIIVKTKLTGKFNIYNITAAIAAAKSAGLKYEEITDTIKDFDPVDGRFNQLKLKNNAIAIVDYSHTPDSLLNALMTIREIMYEMESKGRIITVFGCGGDRDRTKRPLMGDIAVHYSDIAIITSDNPRSEEPYDIIDEIKTGISKDNYMIIENREEAIRNAIAMSDRNDVILVAGKGHETYQEIKGIRHHFSDREVIEKYGK
jgi:UDP-N-acetylmuramoyl-L-alanyl-D-glutamate--2,6-diaminopimelate ligase